VVVLELLDDVLGRTAEVGAITAGSRCTSAGVPRAMRWPKSMTMTRSARSMTRRMSCSTMIIAMCSWSRMSRMKRAMSSVSSAFMPATGSSRRSRTGSIASARPSSIRFLMP
jgi:hypothetical protein